MGPRQTLNQSDPSPHPPPRFPPRYTAGTEGLERGGDYAMLDYISQMPLAAGETFVGACDGDVVDLEDRPSVGTAWCDAALDGRVFVQG